jgi:hypothetical protein
LQEKGLLQINWIVGESGDDPKKRSGSKSKTISKSKSRYLFDTHFGTDCDLDENGFTDGSAQKIPQTRPQLQEPRQGRRNPLNFYPFVYNDLKLNPVHFFHCRQKHEGGKKRLLPLIITGDPWHVP